MFLNPPYGRVIKTWVDKSIAEFESGNVLNAIFLVPNKTETTWFNKLADSCCLMCTIIHRLSFENKDHVMEKCGTFGSVLFLFTESKDIIDKFITEFSKIGKIWQVIK